MEQPLSVRLCGEPFLALPWLPPCAFIVLGEAPFRSGLALRAQTKGWSWGKRVRSSQLAFVNGGMVTPEGLASRRFPLCLSSARSARRMNDAAPMKLAL
jgi:hypothetical protein